MGGWLPGAGRLEGELGSLLVGYHEPRGDAGPCGSRGASAPGIDAAERAALDARLGPLRRADEPVRRDAASSRIRCGSSPRSWSRSRSTSGRAEGVLRAPRYRGLRDDKPAADVVRET